MKKLKRRINAVFRGNDISSTSPVRNWRLSDSMNELAERLAADGVIIEECDIPSGIIPKVPFSAFYMKHNHLPVSVSRYFRTDYSANLKTYSTSQYQYSLFPRQPFPDTESMHAVAKYLRM
ncbi:BMA-PCT-1, isoform i [Dirofilaria immitis]|nr:BMA-PCT-1, isoform i [Dirofilaria immitis]